MKAIEIFVPGLTLVFAIGKVFGFTNMSWFWVFSPLVFAVGIVIASWILMILFAMLIAGVSRNEEELEEFIKAFSKRK